MRIVVDRDVDGSGRVMAEHVIHLDTNPLNTGFHPGSLITPVQILALMTALNASPANRLATGWGVVNQLAGEAAPMTRWARLVAAANAAGADPAVKALALSGT